MELAARTAAWAKSGYTAKDYVQDGLIAMWDGIENAGWGQHNPNATVWKDLVGARNADLTQHGSFTDESLLCDGLGIAAQTTPFDSGIIATLEAVFICKKIPTENTTMFLSGDYISKVFKAHLGVRFAKPNGFIFYRNVFKESLNQKKSISWVLDSVKIDGEDSLSIGSNSLDKTSERGEGCYFGGTLKTPTDCELFNIRCYSRELEQDERAANYAIDKVRFNLP